MSRLRRKKSGDILLIKKKKKKEKKRKKTSQTQDKSDYEVIQEPITLQFLAILPRMVWIKFKQYWYHRVKKGVSVFRKGSGKANLNVSGTFPQDGYDVKCEREK